MRSADCFPTRVRTSSASSTRVTRRAPRPTWLKCNSPSSQNAARRFLRTDGTRNDGAAGQEDSMGILTWTIGAASSLDPDRALAGIRVLLVDDDDDVGDT